MATDKILDATATLDTSQMKASFDDINRRLDEMAAGFQAATNKASDANKKTVSSLDAVDRGAKKIAQLSGAGGPIGRLISDIADVGSGFGALGLAIGGVTAGIGYLWTKFREEQKAAFAEANANAALFTKRLHEAVGAADKLSEVIRSAGGPGKIGSIALGAPIEEIEKAIAVQRSVIATAKASISAIAEETSGPMARLGLVDMEKAVKQITQLREQQRIALETIDALEKRLEGARAIRFDARIREEEAKLEEQEKKRIELAERRKKEEEDAARKLRQEFDAFNNLMLEARFELERSFESATRPLVFPTSLQGLPALTPGGGGVSGDDALVRQTLADFEPVEQAGFFRRTFDRERIDLEQRQADQLREQIAETGEASEHVAALGAAHAAQRAALEDEISTREKESLAINLASAGLLSFAQQLQSFGAGEGFSGRQLLASTLSGAGAAAIAASPFLIGANPALAAGFFAGGSAASILSGRIGRGGQATGGGGGQVIQVNGVYVDGSGSQKAGGQYVGRALRESERYAG